MGVVCLAHDPFIGRPVAVKTNLKSPPRDATRREEFFETFFREAHASGKLAHPNIVSVYDATVEDDRWYLVLEYVDGRSLRQFMQSKKSLPLKTVINLMFQCAKGLDYAHKKGVVHRDIKPANIMVTKKGVAKLTDFGIAALAGFEQEDQRKAAMTIDYASPEQLARKELNHQTDIFSLGVVMYELLTGAKPFQADTDVGTFYKVTHDPPEPMKKHRPDLPDELEAIVLQMLEKKLDQRYQSALEVAHALGNYFDHLKSVQKSMGTEEKTHSLQRLDFFRDFSPRELSEISDASQWVDYKDKDIILAEGEAQNSFYIIIAGQVRISKQDQSLAILDTGQCLGEMAYMGEMTRTANAEAIGHVILMRVEPSFVEKTSLHTQLRFCKAFSKTVIQRLANTSDLLSHFYLQDG